MTNFSTHFSNILNKIHDPQVDHLEKEAAAPPIPIPLYIGIAIRRNGNGNGYRFGIYVHDGFWSYDFYREKSSDGTTAQVNEDIVQFIKNYQKDKQCKIAMAGLTNGQDWLLHDLGRKLWFDLDIVPCYLKSSGGSLDEKSCSAARKTIQHISPTGIPGLCRIDVGFRHEVEVDANGKLSFCSLDDYKPFMKDDTWKQILQTSELVRSRGKRIVFFNSTPQGGGVAIIRHSTIRFFKLLGINAHWFVMKPNPEVFEITKKKFHNVLQGVAPKDTEFTDANAATYEKWCMTNVDSYWKDEDSPVTKADVIVIDDPQPSGMIPLLKKINPHATFVYRSHIEVRSDLIKDPDTIQNRVWRYLWKNISQCDIFISHPIDAFIPDDVKESTLHVEKMPAVTDPCDGLNKHLDEDSLKYYHLLFNRTAFDQIQRRVDFSRPYFIQISRFDPSKGIPDLIEAYLRFRENMNKEENQDGNEERFEIPQLVITGHGSIDDPEGTFIYRSIMTLLDGLKKTEYSDYVDDIIVVRLGPSDQMLNAILASAMCAFQMSHREGFEVKVSEALLKGVPVVAYASGGIPLQIRDGVDGHLLERRDVSAVTNIMHRLATDKDHLRYLQTHARNDNREWVLTPSNVLRWNQIMLRT